MFTELIVRAVAGHMVGDYLFQSDYLAKGKRTDDYLMFAHSVLYTVGVHLVYLLGFNKCLTYEELSFIMFTHMLVDIIKSRGILKVNGKEREDIKLIVDQALHYLTLILIG